jgi:hypothetical protein
LSRLFRPCKSACNDGAYDSDQIGPWSLWQGNLKAELVVVGQHWGDTRYFLTNKGRELAHNPTNETLVKLLRSIGIDIAAPNSEDGQSGCCFFTNAVLCLRQGGLQAKVKPEWFMNCGSRFLLAPHHRSDRAQGGGVALRMGL